MWTVSSAFIWDITFKSVFLNLLQEHPAPATSPAGVLFLYNQNMIKDCFKYTFKCLLYFWCPFGRAGRKEYSYFNNTTLVLACLFVWAIKHLSSHNPALLDTLANEYKIGLCCACVLVVLAAYSVLVRRGHDLGYNWLSTLFHSSEFTMLKGWKFNRRLFKEEGSPFPNEYGPAPEENR